MLSAINPSKMLPDGAELTIGPPCEGTKEAFERLSCSGVCCIFDIINSLLTLHFQLDSMDVDVQNKNEHENKNKNKKNQPGEQASHHNEETLKRRTSEGRYLVYSTNSPLLLNPSLFHYLVPMQVCQNTNEEAEAEAEWLSTMVESPTEGQASVLPRYRRPQNG